MMMRTCLVASLAVVASCGLDEPADGRDDAFLGDAVAPHGIEDGSLEAFGILTVVRTVDENVLRDDPPDGVGLAERAVDNLLYLRLGDDGVAGTADDGVMRTLAQLDEVPFIGPVAFERLLAYAQSHGFIPTVDAPPNTIQLGAYTSCRRVGDGVECWGANTEGRLGNGTTDDSNVPTAVIDLPGKVVELATGGAHSCVRIASEKRIADSSILCWGLNRHSQLGDATLNNSAVPIPVKGLPGGVIQLAGGVENSCALTSDGTVYCWGSTSLREDFAPAPVVPTLPEPIPGLSNVVEITSGGIGACAREAYGRVACWGNDYGQVPVTINGLESGVTAIEMGLHHACALRNGVALCWGNNFSGELGDGTTTDRPTRAEPIAPIGAPVAAISAGGFHTCAVRTDGAVYCWGDNFFGQLGDGTKVDKHVPTPAVGLDAGVLDLSSGGIHTCAQRSDGTTCWGYNEFGQLGDGTRTDRLVPTPVVE